MTVTLGIATMALLLLDVIEAGKILALIPTPSISHQVPVRALMQELARRGHQVTLMTTDPVDHANVTNIDVAFSYDAYRSMFNFVRLSESSYFDTARASIGALMVYLDEQMRSPAMKKLLDDPNTRFDVCFVEIFGQPLVAVKDRFNCSLVMISSLTGWHYNFMSMGSPYNPVAYSHILTHHTGDRTFLQRLMAIYQLAVVHYTRYYEYTYAYDAFVRKHFGEGTRSVDEIDEDVDMLFLNVHPVLGDIRPSVPAIVYMGSMHLKPPKPLPPTYQTLLDTSTNGVIYFSFGSNVQSSELPIEKRLAFLDAFKELPYTVLWKWENDTLPNKPENVHISKWMPQNDILAHPNIKLFITQGGQQSFEESIAQRVPLISMPFLNDQFYTTDKIIKLGMGLGLDPSNLNKDVVKSTIEEVIMNPRYRQSVAKMSDLIKDEPQTPLERAVWWTEYLMRHGNAKHLRAPRIPFYQYYFLDIIGFLLLCTSIVFIVVIYSCKFLLKLLNVLLNIRLPKIDVIKKKD